MTSRYRLITNLSSASIGPVRTWTYALLLEEYEDIFNRGTKAFRIRGFGTDPSWPVFDIFVKSLAYEAAEAASPHVFIGTSGKAKPLMRGAILKFADGGPEIALTTEDDRNPIDVEDFEGDINVVWSALQKKTAKHWSAPNMPTINYFPAAMVRAQRGVR